MNESLISIIMPVYNGAATISNAIQSCLNQTYTYFEIIIVDNASTDDTKKIINTFSSNKIHYIYLPIKGRSNARNAGLKQAKGEYIQFLDADDLLDKNKLLFAMQVFQKENISAVQCTTIYIKDDNIVKKIVPYRGRNFYAQLLIANTIPIHSILLKKDICKQFPNNIDYNEDWMFWIQSLKNTSIRFNYDYSGAIVNVHLNNTMKNIQQMKFYELLILLKYRSVKLPVKYEIIRTIKILKRYIEYILFNIEKIDGIENEIQKNLLFAFTNKILRINCIKKLLNKKIIKLNNDNIYI
jgi:glycosyltransferase involved in cell wall biosynthesis